MKTYSLILIFLLSCHILVGQSEVNIAVGGGVSGYWNKMNYGEQHMSHHQVCHINLLHFFTNELALFYGLEYARYNAKLKLTDLTNYYGRHETIEEDPIHPENLIYFVDITSMNETNTFTTINIPFGLHFQTKFKHANHHYFNRLSAKLSISLAEKTDSKFVGRTYGYYYEGTQQILYDQNDLGFFPKLETRVINHAIDRKPNFLFSYETGFKWCIKNNVSISTSLYVDLGITDVSHAEKEKILDYDGHQIQYNSILNSKFIQGTLERPFAQSFNLLAFGFKLSLNIGFGHKKVLPEQNNYELKEQTANTTHDATTQHIDNLFFANKIIHADNIHADNDVNIDGVIMTDTTYRKKRTYQRDNVRNSNMQHEFNPEHPNYIPAETITLEDYYELNQVHLTDIMKKKIDDIWTRIKPYLTNESILVVEGHTCDIGTSRDNETVGLWRAEEVKKYIHSKGFPIERIFATTKAATQPLLPNANEDSRKRNRRVQLTILY